MVRLAEETGEELSQGFLQGTELREEAHLLSGEKKREFYRDTQRRGRPSLAGLKVGGPIGGGGGGVDSPPMQTARGRAGGQLKSSQGSHKSKKKTGGPKNPEKGRACVYGQGRSAGDGFAEEVCSALI